MFGFGAFLEWSSCLEWLFLRRVVLVFVDGRVVFDWEYGLNDVFIVRDEGLYLLVSGKIVLYFFFVLKVELEV